MSPNMDERVTLNAADGASLTVLIQRPDHEQGSALILLHGAASNHTRWWHFTHHSALRHHHRLVCPDLRGHGDSLWRGPATLHHWCQDLRQLLARQQLDRAILVGHCLGANLAIRFANDFPEHCSGLVLIEPMLRPALRGKLASLSHFIWLLIPIIAVVQLANRAGLYRRQLQRVDLEQLDRQWHAEAGDADMAERFGAPCHDLKVVPTAQYLSNLLAVLQSPPLDGVRCPVLAIVPKGRRMTDPYRSRLELAHLSRLEICELEADHWIPTRQPQAMATCIDQWVERLDSLMQNGR